MTIDNTWLHDTLESDVQFRIIQFRLGGMGGGGGCVVMRLLTLRSAPLHHRHETA